MNSRAAGVFIGHSLAAPSNPRVIPDKVLPDLDVYRIVSANSPRPMVKRFGASGVTAPLSKVIVVCVAVIAAASSVTGLLTIPGYICMFFTSFLQC